jgi:AraC-like DNA-binding protein
MSVDCFIGVHIATSYLKEVSCQINNSSYFSFDNIPVPACDQIKYLMQCFISESSNRQAGYNFILDSLSTQLSVNLLRHAKLSKSSKAQDEKPPGSKDIIRVIEFFREHYTSNNYSSVEIAKLANLSPYHFIRAFKQHTGKTPYEYLIDIKLEKAKEMLKNKRCSITEVCFSCGFANHSHFSTVFKKRLGVTPTEYRAAIND